MTDVFISYSRHNLDFARRLRQALEAHYTTWMDEQSIMASVDWWQEICQAIDNADRVLFIITPEALQSEFCTREISRARDKHKSIIPLIRAPVEANNRLHLDIIDGIFDRAWEQQARANWRYLKTRQFLFFDDDAQFDTAFARLLEALATDPLYLQEHTRLLERSARWLHHDRAPELLLRGDDLFAATQWLQQGATKEPGPTPDQIAYINASIEERTREEQRAAAERLRTRHLWQARFGLVLAIALVAMLGFLFALQESGNSPAGATIDELRATQSHLQTESTDLRATIDAYETTSSAP